MIPTPNAKSRGLLAAAILLLASWLLIGIPIALSSPGSINQDTYHYLSIANYYLQTPSWHIRGAYTVGPVIPALLALVKWAVLQVCTWTPDVDVGIVKLASLGCYITITVAAVKYHERKGITALASAFVIGVLLFTLPPEPDALSLNGELVCAAWLALIFVIASKPKPQLYDDPLIVLLALLVFYTKLQAVLMLAATFCTCFTGRRRWRLILLSAAVFCAVDLVLLYQGTGWLAELTGLGSYVQHGHGGAEYPIGTLRWFYASISSPLSHISWVLRATFYFFPIAVSAIIAALAMRPDRESANLMLWVLVYLASVVIPGRAFDHYLLCFIPVAFLFSHLSLERLGMSAPKAKIALAVMLGLVAIRFCSTIPDARSFRREQLVGIIPRQLISAEATAVRDQHLIQPGDSLYVHGWDFRYYSYFNKASNGPVLGFVQWGLQDSQEYIRDVIQAKPTFILDVVQHSGLVRDPALALEAKAAWSKSIKVAYQQVFNRNGLVIYRRRDPVGDRAPELHPEPGATHPSSGGQP